MKSPALRLPRVMVAPNGARLQKSDHPGLPVAIPEIVACARACHEAGADGIHAHVRDASGRHVLDAGLYRELMTELAAAVPAMAVQITTEAVGLYTANEQRRLVRDIHPAMVSVSVREMLSDGDMAAALEFYSFCASEAISVQHIIYAVADLERFLSLDMAKRNSQLLFVLGSYQGRLAQPQDLDPFLAMLARHDDLAPDWAVCAFGPAETDCLVHAAGKGGKVRVGFENNRINRDGTTAEGNEDRVAEVVAAIDLTG